MYICSYPTQQKRRTGRGDTFEHEERETWSIRDKVTGREFFMNGPTN